MKWSPSRPQQLNEMIRSESWIAQPSSVLLPTQQVWVVPVIEMKFLPSSYILTLKDGLDFLIQTISFCYRDLPFPFHSISLFCHPNLRPIYNTSFVWKIWSDIAWLLNIQHFCVPNTLSAANQFNIFVFVKVVLAIVWPAMIHIWDKWLGVARCQQLIFCIWHW